MPLVGGGNAVAISFDGDAADLIAASNDVIKAINLQNHFIKILNFDKVCLVANIRNLQQINVFG